MIVLPEQKEVIEQGYKYLKKHNRVYLALNAGAGKTFIALFLAKLLGANKVTVVVSKVLHTPWKLEVEKHEVLHGMEIETSTYESLDYLKLDNDAVVVFDECHSKLSNTKTKRTRNYGKVIKHRPNTRRIYLSATPFSKPIQLFPVLKHENIIKDWFGFVHTYCDAKRTPFGLDTDGASNMPKLKEILTTEKEFFLLSGYAKKADKYSVQQEIYVAGAENSNSDFASVTVDQIVSFLKKPTTLIPFEEYSDRRRETGEEKLEDLIKYVLSLDKNTKRLIFMHHTDLADTLHEAIPNSATVHGKNTQKTNDKAISGFRTGDTNILILSLTSASEGLNLVEATHTIFGELPWNAYQLFQAKKRIDRYGQTSDVKMTYFVRENSLDHALANTITKKTFNIEDFIGKSFI